VRPSRSVSWLRAQVFRWWPVARLYARASAVRAGRRRGAPAAGARDIYAPHGAIMAIHRRYFDAGSTLDHPPFMFAEELTVAENVRRTGGRVFFDPTLRVVHAAHQAIGAGPSERVWRWQREATRYSYDLMRSSPH
jgi:hypothetical protein